MHPLANLAILICTAAACGYAMGSLELPAFPSMAAGMFLTGCVAVALPW